jgi:acyl phosphate:glycerol-3-phosphate acyltransferase
VASGLGGMLAVQPAVALIAAPVFVVVILTTRYVSLGSLIATASGGVVAVVFMALGWLSPAWLAYVVPGVAIVWLAHRDNIGRLLSGTERRVTLPGRTPTPPPA